MGRGSAMNTLAVGWDIDRIRDPAERNPTREMWAMLNRHDSANGFSYLIFIAGSFFSTILILGGFGDEASQMPGWLIAVFCACTVSVSYGLGSAYYWKFEHEEHRATYDEIVAMVAREGGKERLRFLVSKSRYTPSHIKDLAK